MKYCCTLPNRDYSAKYDIRPLWKNIYELRFCMLEKGKRINGNRITSKTFEVKDDKSLFAYDMHAQIILKAIMRSHLRKHAPKEPKPNPVGHYLPPYKWEKTTD